jgi:Rps23 Pro-64 3,4-dihydroxylase Tpa1-like proline 4-hydroxylase
MKKAKRSANTIYGAETSNGEAPAPMEIFIKRDFLPQKELRSLTKYIFSHEDEFTPSTVIPDGVPEGASDPTYRKSRVLYELGDYAALVEERLLAILPDVLSAFNREAFPLSHIDKQVTASNDGDFFKVHRDNAPVEPLDIPLRELTYVHYFHSEPKAFSGGQLRIYEVHDGDIQDTENRRSKTIVPRQNTLVFFPSTYDHEVLPVKCPTRKFVNSRFTVNGWFIRDASETPEETPEETSPDMGWLVDAARRLSVARPQPFMKIYLTLEEASEFSGLSYEYLQRLIEEERVTAIDDFGWKIRRADLEQL